MKIIAMVMFGASVVSIVTGAFLLAEVPELIVAGAIFSLAGCVSMSQVSL